ncbi:MAG: hypothetical protein H0U66_06640 [Gemmatimonadaceae bacterium]|nr:hypothetical protein [Gemmatimonadaceae bacterium]
MPFPKLNAEQKQAVYAERAEAVEKATKSLRGRLEYCPASKLWAALFVGGWKREYEPETLVELELSALGIVTVGKNGAVRWKFVGHVCAGLRVTLSTDVRRKVEL